MRTIQEKAEMWDAICDNNKLPCDICKYEKFWDEVGLYLKDLRKSLDFYEERDYGIPPYLKKTHDKILDYQSSSSTIQDSTESLI